MSFYTASATLASEVASGGTFTVDYPTGTNAGNFENTRGHKLYVAGHQHLYDYPSDFTLSFGASEITVTFNGATAIPEDSSVTLQLDELAADDAADFTETTLQGVLRMQTAVLDLGAPDTADADGVCASQAGTADTAMTIGGALASGGVATFDVPRNVVAAWTTSAKLTITGTDVNGDTVVETTGSSGTTHTGKKAFKTVTSVVPDTNITGATVGTGDVFGLPVRLPATGYVLAELEDGAAASAGTVVAADDSEATATTGDVRGTYDPSSAADGSTAFKLIAAMPSLADTGISQYGG